MFHSVQSNGTHAVIYVIERLTNDKYDTSDEEERRKLPGVDLEHIIMGQKYYYLTLFVSNKALAKIKP